MRHPWASTPRCGASFDVASLRVNLAFAQAGIESTQLQLPLAYRYQN
jgi:hypothetical protein